MAGKQKGKGDDRYLWPEMLRVIRELAPRWVFGENVPGILRIAAGDVVQDLEREGYDVAVFDFEAAAVGAPHRRERIAFIANRHSDSSRPRRAESEGQQREAGVANGGDDMAHADSAGLQGRDGAELSECSGQRIAWENGSYLAYTESWREQGQQSIGSEARRFSSVGEPISNADNGRGLMRRNRELSTASSSERTGRYNGGRTPECVTGQWWTTQSRLGMPHDGLSRWMVGCMKMWADGSWDYGVPRLATGVPNRVDKLKSLGNAVVPQWAYPIFKAIAEIETEE